MSSAKAKLQLRLLRSGVPRFFLPVQWYARPLT